MKKQKECSCNLIHGYGIDGFCLNCHNKEITLVKLEILEAWNKEHIVRNERKYWLEEQIKKLKRQLNER